MKKATILVIDDEKDLIELVRYNLEKNGYEVIGAGDGATGLQIARQHKPDCVVLDLMMPGMDGLEVCKQMRADARTSSMPIIMLTAKSEETDRIIGLEMGADDYISKPFSPRELVARVRAILRRTGSGEQSPDTLKVGQLLMDVTRHEVTCEGNAISLTATEFRILQYILSRPGRVLSRDEIIDGGMGRDTAVFDRTIDVHMTSIRKKLGKCGQLIETVRGFGYKLNDLTEVAR